MRSKERASSPGRRRGSEALLSIDGLTVAFPRHGEWVPVVRDLSLSLAPGERLGIVGESGSGKSVTGLCVMGLLPPPGQVRAGSVRLDDVELTQLSPRGWTRYRGSRIGMVFQDPQTSLNPVHRIGEQIAEALLLHHRMSRSAAWERAVEMLDRLGVPSARERARDYPHRLSGGMRQRAMIAMALAGDPDLLIADEPTTALDATVQAQILALLEEVVVERRMALVLISHDLGVVADSVDRVLVMYAGRCVESGPARAVLEAPEHPYTLGLRSATPQLDGVGRTRLPTIPGQPPRPEALPAGCAFEPRCAVGRGRVDCRTDAPTLVGDVGLGRATACHHTTAVAELDWSPSVARPEAEDETGTDLASASRPVLEVDALSKVFPVRRGLLGRARLAVSAVEQVSLRLYPGETIGVVGESGCGKSTLARCLVSLHRPTSGTIKVRGTDLTSAQGDALQHIRRMTQMVFQDPFSSLDPHFSAARIIAEPLRAHGIGDRAARRQRVAELLEKVGLSPDDSGRLPGSFSGGQRQRLAIARALAPDPEIVICDEAVSALDVSIQAQILNLLKDLQDELGHAYLFISHDLAVVRHLAHRVAVMYLGRVVEEASTESLFTQPLHPYTQALIAAVPSRGPGAGERRRLIVSGDMPSPLDPPSGCRFHPRCPFAQDRCREERPEPRRVLPHHRVACHFAEDILEGRLEPAAESVSQGVGAEA